MGGAMRCNFWYETIQEINDFSGPVTISCLLPCVHCVQFCALWDCKASRDEPVFQLCEEYFTHRTLIIFVQKVHWKKHLPLNSYSSYALEMGMKEWKRRVYIHGACLWIFTYSSNYTYLLCLSPHPLALGVCGHTAQCGSCHQAIPWVAGWIWVLDFGDCPWYSVTNPGSQTYFQTLPLEFVRPWRYKPTGNPAGRSMEISPCWTKKGAHPQFSWAAVSFGCQTCPAGWTQLCSRVMAPKGLTTFVPTLWTHFGCCWGCSCLR